ncbi:MAG TPA: hypothetical protein VNN06_06975, partial [Ramlibacter sp.]|nr:hypothetical protein [Ramlibacter sp.]
MSTGKSTSQSLDALDKAALAKAIEDVTWRVKELRTFDSSGIQERWDPRLEALQKKVNTTLGDILGGRAPEYKQYSIGALDAGLDSMFGDRYSPDELQQTIKDNINQAIG